MGETEEIEKRYQKREKRPLTPLEKMFSDFMVKERESVFEKFISARFNHIRDLSVLEIGAGAGMNIPFFLRLGISSKAIFANELIEERVNELKAGYPFIRVYAGDAMKIPEDRKYSVVFQSTVFSSVLDDAFRRALADKMWRLTEPGGMILWYDFIYNNPRNPDVRKVTVREIRDLFKDARGIRFRKVTLAPPIGRRAGRLYPVLNLFPFLRTHVAAAIFKDD